jgi:hypothetical protein
LTGEYNITNNFFAGYQYTGPQAIATGGSYRGVLVRATTTTAVADVRIYHNSFHMPNIPNITSPNRADSYFAVGVNSTNVNYGFNGTVDVKNNIFDVEQNNIVVFFRTSTLPGSGSLTSNYNTYYLGGAGARMAAYINTGANTTANHATLESWQAAGFDTQSLIANPRVASAGLGKWVSATDLHFDGPVSPDFTGTDVGVAADIDGEVRTVPIIGADEVELANITAARDWMIFE